MECICPAGPRHHHLTTSNKKEDLYFFHMCCLFFVQYERCIFGMLHVGTSRITTPPPHCFCAHIRREEETKRISGFSTRNSVHHIALLVLEHAYVRFAIALVFVSRKDWRKKEEFIDQGQIESVGPGKALLH